MHRNPALEVSELVCAYDAGRGMFSPGSRRMVIDRISFAIGSGECFGILGDSGSGKSTIARCIAGLTEPESGKIAIQGLNVFPRKENRKRAAGKVQMLYQDHAASLDPVMTIGDSLCEALRIPRGGRRRRDEHHAAMLEDLLAQVGLHRSVLERLPGALSGGERQRAALARSIAADPAVLILDEPTSALDAVTQDRVLDLIASLQRQRSLAVLFITHDIDAAARLCSRIAVLHHGVFVEQDTADAVLTAPSHQYTRHIVSLRSLA